jgi:pimeloyl-ACP methyl ester carboxylesterase
MGEVTLPRIWRAMRVLHSLSSNAVVGEAFAEYAVAPKGAIARYAPRDPRGPALVLLHGASARGAKDERLVRLARVLAREGVVSYVPHLSGLANFSEDLDDLSRIEQSMELAGSGSDRQISILGFSLGGGYGLVCAAKPELAATVERVTVVGGHHRLHDVWSNMSSRLQGLANHIEEATETELYFALGCAAPRLGERQLGFDATRSLRSLLWNFCGGVDLELARTFAKTHLLPHWSVIERCQATARSAALSPAGKLGDVRASVALLHAPDDELVSLTHATQNLGELSLRCGMAQSLLSTRLLDHVQPRLSESLREVPGIIRRFAELMP